jgi:hypothetical protein
MSVLLSRVRDPLAGILGSVHGSGGILADPADGVCATRNEQRTGEQRNDCICLCFHGRLTLSR